MWRCPLHLNLSSYGSVEFDEPAYALRYSYNEDGFVLKNLSSKQRRFKVDLSALSSTNAYHRFKGKLPTGPITTITLNPQEEAHWVCDQ